MLSHFLFHPHVCQATIYHPILVSFLNNLLFCSFERSRQHNDLNYYQVFAHNASYMLNILFELAPPPQPFAMVVVSHYQASNRPESPVLKYRPLIAHYTFSCFVNPNRQCHLSDLIH